MKLFGIHLAACVPGKVLPDVPRRAVVSCMILCKANHVLGCVSSSLLPHPHVVVSPLRLETVGENKITNAMRKRSWGFFLAFQFSFFQMTLEELEPVNALSKEQGFF